MTKVTNFKLKRSYLLRTELYHKLIHNPSAGGIMLVVFALVAFVLANTPSTAAAFHHFWLTDITLGFGDFSVTKSLEYLINDGLMVIFFFYVGLEIKREILAGQLSSFKKASLPIVAAIGGMVVPAAIYIIININNPLTVSGWGIPMATDIAFAIGILSLLGNKVPISLKIFLTALAIVDDLGAILVIALFYPSEHGLNYTMLLLAAAVFGYMMLLARLNIYKLRYYLLPAIILWILFLNSGVHATIAGVLIALAIPSTPRFSKKFFLYKTKYYLNTFIFRNKEDVPVLGNPQQHQALETMRSIVTDTISPSQRLEYSLHNVVAFFIMPLFALANAGVTMSGSVSDVLTSNEGLGIFAGLVIGKPLGIGLFCWVAVRFGVAVMPVNANWKTLIGVACLGGIGFTMSIFVTNLAFGGSDVIMYKDSAKLAIMMASLAAGVLGAVWLIVFGTKQGKDPHNFH